MKHFLKLHFEVLPLLSILILNTPALADQLTGFQSASEFETIIAKSENTSVPYPYTALVQLLGGSLSEDVLGEVVSTLIPYGRSLVKNQADSKQPRIVSVVLTGSTPASFIGYAPKSNKLEVLSWNNTLGKYDFLVVTNYQSGGQPQIHRPNPAACLTCHQGGGPIYSRQGWNESRSSDQDAFERKLKGDLAPGLNPVPAHFSGGGMDDQIRRANDQLQGVRVCRLACGEDLSCRSKLVLAALAGSQIQNSASIRQELAAAIRLSVQSRWAQDAFSYASDVIPDRDPLKEPMHGGLVTQLHISDLNRFKGASDAQLSTLQKNQLEAEFRAGIDYTYSHVGAHLAIDEEHAGLTQISLPYDDPTSHGKPSLQRPKISAIPVAFSGEYLIGQVYNSDSSSCLGFSFEDLTAFQAVPYETLKAILSTPDAIKMLANWPPNSGQITELVRQATKKIPSLGSPCLRPSSQALLPIDSIQTIVEMSGR